jgi:hypothetical protein
MREHSLGGDQDLTFWLRYLEEVLRELLGDKRVIHQRDSLCTGVHSVHTGVIMAKCALLK